MIIGRLYLNKHSFLGCVCLLLLSLTACGAPQVTPFAATLPATQAVSLLPTLTPSHTPTATYTPTLTPTPTATYTPTLTPTFTPTLTPTPTFTPSVTPTFTPTQTFTPIPTATFANPADDPNYTPPPTWTPPPESPGVTLNDHYRLRRPIPNAQTDYGDRTYPYGGTSGGTYRIHHGLDFQNPSGTPVIAAADGTVYYAGDDIASIFGPQPNFYGNVVVIQHGFSSPEGQPVYTLYGHLSQISVATGQPVATGDRIGSVGAAGIAIGPHLHFEVRVGDPQSYFATRNPDLWIYPYSGFGTLAGRVTDATGAPLSNVTIQLDAPDGRRAVSRYAFSYAENTVNPDPTFGENFTIGDLPANYYEVTVRANGRRLFQRVIYVYPAKTTWIDIQLNN